MQIARVVGHGVSTVKHASLTGWKLLIAQPLTADFNPDGEPLLVIDHHGAGTDDLVIICNDGAGARELVNARNSPVRWFVMGIRDIVASRGA